LINVFSIAPAGDSEKEHFMAGGLDASGDPRMVSASSRPAIGLIVPPRRGSVPSDAAAMYPGLRFEVEGLGLAEMSADAYGPAVERVGGCAAALASRGCCAVFLFGTSLSFFRGPAFNGGIEGVMRGASGLPAATLTGALSDALRQMKVRRFAAATAYTGEVNRLFRAYFEADGFAIASLHGMDISALSQVEAVGEQAIADLAARALGEAADADALVISCAGLRTAGIVPELERRFGLPVLSSSMVGAWAAARLAGHSGAAPGMGRLYEG
jgi:arylmalonate decarboxylase